MTMKKGKQQKNSPSPRVKGGNKQVSRPLPINLNHLQRVIKEPTIHNLTPSVMLQLQTSYGNRFVGQLVQRARQNTAVSVQTNRPVVQRGSKSQETETDGFSSDENAISNIIDGIDFGDETGDSLEDVLSESMIDNLLSPDLNEVIPVDEIDGLLSPSINEVLSDDEIDRLLSPELSEVLSINEIDTILEQSLDDRLNEVDINLAIARQRLQSQTDAPNSQKTSTFGTIVKVGKGAAEVNSQVGAGMTIHSNSRDLLKILRTGKSVQKDMKKGSSGLTRLLNTLKNSNILKVFAKYLLPVYDVIKGIIESKIKHKTMMGFKNLASSIGITDPGKVKASRYTDSDIDSKALVASYGYQKTRRGFIARVGLTVATFAQLISRILTIVTGGTSAIVTEAIDLAIGLKKSVWALSKKLKGGLKHVMGTRTRKRTQAAELIVSKALEGDTQMLQFLIDGGILGAKWRAKMQVGTGFKVGGKKVVHQSVSNWLKEKGVNYKFMTVVPTNSEDRDFLATHDPQDTESMLKYINLLKKYKSVSQLKDEVVESMKSQ